LEKKIQNFWVLFNIKSGHSYGSSRARLGSSSKNQLNYFFQIFVFVLVRSSLYQYST